MKKNQTLGQVISLQESFSLVAFQRRVTLGLLANRHSGPQYLWPQVWLLGQAAELLWGVEHWKEGDDVYESAEEYLQRSIATIANSDPNKLAIATNLNGLAEISLQRADFSKAEQYYRQALAITEKLASESLGVAVSLMGLGKVARAKADRAWEEEYYRRALAIRQRMVPGSLVVAASLTGPCLKRIPILTRQISFFLKYLLTQSLSGCKIPFT